MRKKVVLLLSGGIDSVVLYYWLRKRKYDIFPIHINYGQVTVSGEIRAIKSIIGNEYADKVLFLDISNMKHLGSGSLVGDSPQSGYSAEEWFNTEFFPNRNMILISLAGAYAYKNDIRKIAIGVTGSRSYKDTSKSFIESISTTLSESLHEFELITPFVGLDRQIVIDEAINMSVPIEKTFSCNALGDRHCLLCTSCLDRLEVLRQMGKHNAF
ncbi:MAG: 7-cyano-7-deazaguanine synthase [Bacillaceae bacterium]|nr:7-cyano-7-deazaguanine synthase [Bacillaceae bacterium]